jgi:hypothetical protein
MIDNISEKISEIEKQLNNYKTDRQIRLEMFKIDSGLNNFIAETDRQIAYFQGQIDILKSLLGIPEQNKVEKIESN